MVRFVEIVQVERHLPLGIAGLRDLENDGLIGHLLDPVRVDQEEYDSDQQDRLREVHELRHDFLRRHVSWQQIRAVEVFAHPTGV